MALQIKKATKEKIKLRMAIDGPTGAGKTYTALRFAHQLTSGDKILVIDSERRSASKYVGENPDGIPWEFSVIDLPDHSPTTYIEAVNLGAREGFEVIVIDSLSHAWIGNNGVLEIKDRKGGRFQDWREVTPLHNQMVDAILNCPSHVIATMRTKMEYAMEDEEDAKGRYKTTVKKMGMAPIQRAGVEYEFDVIIDMDQQNIATVTKTRCSAINGAKRVKPHGAFIDPVIEWLNSGDEPKEEGETKGQFFKRVEDNLKLKPNAAAWLLGELGYEKGSYVSDKAQEMYDKMLGWLEENKLRFYGQVTADHGFFDTETEAILSALEMPFEDNINNLPVIHQVLGLQRNQPSCWPAVLVAANAQTKNDDCPNGYYARNPELLENLYHLKGSIQKQDPEFPGDDVGQDKAQWWKDALVLSVRYAKDQMKLKDDEASDSGAKQSDALDEWFPREAEAEAA